MSPPQNENGEESLSTANKKEKKLTPEICTQLTQEEERQAVQSLCKLISYPTVSSTSVSSGAYVECAKYLISELKSIGGGCLSNVHILEESPSHSPVVMACWEGTDPKLPVILLNSHYDVVPALDEDWTVDPFKGFVQDGKIYGRGAQDMKCVCVQYMQAIRVLARLGFQPQRSIYLSFVPDEEVGGGGMAAFLESKLYRELPGIALALDEGLASETETYSVFYGERLPWWVGVEAYGNTGHGSRFIESTAVEQLIALANKALEFRQKQRDLLFGEHKHAGCAHAVAKKKLGDVTTINITTMQAGVQVGDTYAYNCCPPVAKCSLDIRISPHVEPSEMKDLLNGWCKECSAPGVRGLSWNFIGGEGNSDSMGHHTTSTDGKVNPWYNVFANAVTGMGMSLQPDVFPAATDSRFLRALGVRALGFSPMRNSEIMLHENDEYLLESVFLEGIGVYVDVIRALASQGKEVDDITVENNKA